MEKKKNGCLTAVLCVVVFCCFSCGTASCINDVLTKNDAKNASRTAPVSVSGTESGTESETETESATAEIETATAEIETETAETETLTTETETLTTETEIITTETEIETEPQPVILHFIVNSDSCCIHIDPHCTAAESIDQEHRQEIDIPENDLSSYAGKYWACGKCSRKYSSSLPKFEN